MMNRNIAATYSLYPFAAATEGRQQARQTRSSTCLTLPPISLSHACNLQGANAGEMVGFICGTCCPGSELSHETMSGHDPAGPTLCIHSVVVDEKFRRKGYATTMLKVYVCVCVRACFNLCVYACFCLCVSARAPVAEDAHRV